MDNKILMYPKPHVIRVPDNWYEMELDDQKAFCEKYCQSANFVLDDFHNLKKAEAVERLEKMFGVARRE